MISVRRRGASHIHIRVHGLQKTDEFLALADLFKERSSPAPRLVICLDWSDLVSWDFRPPGGDEITNWIGAAIFIKRVAIVHGHRWNRQAAWFAAVLRTGGVEVHSYAATDREKANAWLNSAQPSRKATAYL
jgi:hypothetical protein